MVPITIKNSSYYNESAFVIILEVMQALNFLNSARNVRNISVEFGEIVIFDFSLKLDNFDEHFLKLVPFAFGCASLIFLIYLFICVLKHTFLLTPFQ